MANTKLDVAEMSNLQSKIDEEIKEAKAVLKQVHQCCEKNPADDDAILKTIEETGKQLEESWNNLFNTFDQVGSVFGNLFKDYANFLERKKEEIKNMKKNL